MNLGLITVFILFSLFLVFLYKESTEIQNIHSSLHLVVGVNGTRGKSSVTRLLHSVLAENGHTVLSKTTGTAPHLFFQDRERKIEWDIQRITEPNLLETKSLFFEAKKRGAKTLVVECMAIQPEYQKVWSRSIVRQSILILTNVRRDHLKEMGPDLERVVKAFGSTFPIGGKVFTWENDYQGLMKQIADQNQSEIYFFPLSSVDQIPDSYLDEMSYIEHAENIALVLETCHKLGIDKSIALRAMKKAKPDPGALQVWHIPSMYGRDWIFANGFAANDPDSLVKIMDILENKFPDTKPILLLNLRHDRPDRTKLFFQAISENQWQFLDITPLKSDSEWTEKLLSLSSSQHKNLFVGVGNISGNGAKLVEFFRNRA